MNKLSFWLVLVITLLCMLAGLNIPAQAGGQAQQSNPKVYLPLLMKEYVPNRAPNIPNTPHPVAGASNQLLSLTLSWKGGDPDGDAVTYTVYLNAGSANPTTVVSTNQPGLSYTASGLKTNTVYSWRIVARDAQGASRSGPVWSFTTTATQPSVANRLDATLNTTCAVTSAGRVKCWGESVSKLGSDPLYPNVNRATLIPNLTDVKYISLGHDFACALTNAGGVKCWGQNGQGQLGRGNKTDTLMPEYVSGLSSGVKAVSTGDWFACALTTGGAVKCWGNNARGQLGNAQATGTGPVTTPVNVVGLESGVTALVSSDRHSCALKNGGVWCWGSNEFGQIGKIAGLQVDDFIYPVQPDGLTSGVAGIAVGGSTSCAVLSGGGLKCWGKNTCGQVGDGTTFDAYAPENVTGLSNGVKLVSVGWLTTCALMNNGTVKCWGYNDKGQVGNGVASYDYVLAPVTVNGVTGGLDITNGYQQTCAVFSGDMIKCWGGNEYGQLGDGTNTDSLAPVTVLDN